VRPRVTTTSGTFSFEFPSRRRLRGKSRGKGFRKFACAPRGKALVSNVTDVPVALEVGEVSST